MEETSSASCVGFIGVHLGAGNHSNSRLPEYRKVCKRACRKAMEAIRLKKTALESLSIAIKTLEDCPLTNAGIGSNLSLAGTVECDASIMEGKTSNFGAVGALKGIKNPIMVAKRLIEEQCIPLPSGRVPPIFLCGEGARDWAVNHGVPEVLEKSLITGKAFSTFQKYTKLAKEDEGTKRRNDTAGCSKPRKMLKVDNQKLMDDDRPLDTIGAVCLDSFGNLCSGVSSGGLLLKYPGRIGQAAVYGSGCWSTNITQDTPVGIACSSSGCGEQLIKTMLCKECGDLCCDRSANRDGITTLKDLLQNKFLGSSRLLATAEKLVGIILLRCHVENFPQVMCEDSKSMNIEFAWGHSTQTMAVGYMSVADPKPKFQLTKLDPNCSPGNSIVLQGVIENQLLKTSEVETD